MLRLDLRGREKLLAANGLAVIEATPMQVARAMAGLATGALPELRIARRAGELELPRRARPLALSARSLAAVREGMRAVTAASAGSAHAALGPEQLGFSMCAKTGSADLQSAGSDSLDGEDRRVRKHSWLAGWFPAERPVGVLVVFLDETLATAGSSAVWIAHQYLQQPAVQAWLAEEGVVPR
jgi:cell division protein FtsI/penicillin-binding protein 2